MKKTVPAILLVLALVLGIAACVPKIPTDGNGTTISGLTEPPPSDPPPGPTTLPTELPPEPGPTPTAPDFDPTVSGVTTAQIIEYFNACINRARGAKPVYIKVWRQTVKGLRFPGIPSLIEKQVADIAQKMIDEKMPDILHEGPRNPKDKDYDIAKDFFGMTKISAVRPGDVSSVTAKKTAEGYEVMLTYGSERNAEKDGRSKYSRIFSIASRQDVLDELKDSLAANPNETTFIFKNGKAVIVVDPENGNVKKAHAEFEVDIDAPNVTITAIPLIKPTVDLTARQNTTIDWKDFKY